MYFLLIACLSLASLVAGATYQRTQNIVGSDFLSAFSFQAISDPTHGRVNYVNAQTAASQNLTFASGNTFVLRADSKTVLNPNGPGRNSVRLQSNQQFTTAVTIFDVTHMPQGCGTWPALWAVGNNWPNEGEIDILEGVNDQSPNQASLHTSSGCTMPGNQVQTGSSVGGNNCDAIATSDTGCGVKFNDATSYGPTFNNNGGGWFALERTNSFVKAWYWPRNGNVPSDVRSGSTSINTNNWGTPAANWPSTSCSLAQKLGPHNIIINCRFFNSCGDWAGSVYSTSGCPSTCEDYVNNNPSAFANAYFQFNSLRIFQ
ncbi:putative laminarinase [Favolaschia claudopus]|uniref:Laminarinase n=1 Tax=Favolaschia claudopus TaxID=2862362 RepID=A0AAW0CYZ9_9AGAR